jgi:hypothetical protein
MDREVAQIFHSGNPTASLGALKSFKPVQIVKAVQIVSEARWVRIVKAVSTNRRAVRKVAKPRFTAYG